MSILRMASEPRLFPPVDSDSCEGTGLVPNTASERLLCSARDTISKFKLWTGWRLDTAGRIARLIATHRDAVRAELAGQWARAAFLWDESARQLDRLTPENWEASARACGFSDTPDDWRRRVLTEVLLDTHLALYNGYLSGHPDRALLHLVRLEALAERCGLSAAERSRLLASAWDDRIRILRAKGDFQSAIRFAEERIDAEPDRLDHEETYVDIVMQQATAPLQTTGNSTQAIHKDEAIDTGIATLERATRQRPRSASAYGALAALHRIRAVQLANGGRLSTALLHLAKAQSYEPDMEGLAEDEQKLVAMMQKLRTEMVEVAQQLKDRPGLTLSLEGQRLRLEAETGFSLLNGYRDSAQDQDVRAKADDARAFRIWRRAGLPDPPDRWAERSKALLRALNQTLAGDPKDEHELERCWLSFAKKDNDIRHVSFENVRGLLLREVEGDAALPVTESAPQLPIAEKEVRSPHEPFAYWFFSRRGPYLKALAGAAVVMLIIAVTATAAAKMDSAKRETAWAEMIAASRQGDDDKVIAAAERFFSVDARSVDARVDDARQMYETALLRWFARLQGEPDAQARARVTRYKHLVAHLTPGGRT